MDLEKFLNLEKLKSIIDFEVENLHDKQPKDIPVLITLSESSIGARASIGVKYVGMGFDWEHGQLRIEPNIPLTRKGESLLDIKKVIRHEFGGQSFNACPRCIHRVAKDDCYCRNCGQRLR